MCSIHRPAPQCRDEVLGLSCFLTWVQQQLSNTSPPDCECHIVVATLHHGLQPLPDLLPAPVPLTFDPILALKDMRGEKNLEQLQF